MVAAHDDAVVSSGHGVLRSVAVSAQYGGDQAPRCVHRSTLRGQHSTASGVVHMTLLGATFEKRFDGNVKKTEPLLLIPINLDGMKVRVYFH